MAKPKGLFILDPTWFDTVYGPEERCDLGNLIDIQNRPFSPDVIKRFPEMLSEVEFVFSTWGGPCLDAEFLDAAPKLKAFFYAAGTIKWIATAEFWRREIPITTASIANSIPVAELTHAEIILSLKRGWWYMDEIRKRGAWPNSVEEKIEVPGAYRSTVGIFSMGTIGRMVREKLRDSDIRVIVYDPYISEREAEGLNVELVSMEELFRRSDVVSIHAPLLKETEYCIGKPLFEMMKPNATFINTARGMLVREEEMVEVLQKRPDLYAILDVAKWEPPKENSPLFKLPNVRMTPHIAGSMNHECRRMGHLMVEEAERFLSGQPMRWQVVRERAHMSA